MRCITPFRGDVMSHLVPFITGRVMRDAGGGSRYGKVTLRDVLARLVLAGACRVPG